MQPVGDLVRRGEIRRLALTFFVVATLGGCGSTNKDRAVSGGSIGAGVGTVTGLAIGGPLAGLVLGGVFGAATGLATDESIIDLGEPLWNDGPTDPENGETKPPDDQPSEEIDPTGFDRGFEILE